MPYLLQYHLSSSIRSLLSEMIHLQVHASFSTLDIALKSIWSTNKVGRSRIEMAMLLSKHWALCQFQGPIVHGESEVDAE